MGPITVGVGCESGETIHYEAEVDSVDKAKLVTLDTMHSECRVSLVKVNQVIISLVV